MSTGITAADQKLQPVTHEDIWLMQRPGEPVSSPDGQYSSSDTVYNREIMNGEEARYYWQEVHAWLAKYLGDK